MSKGALSRVTELEGSKLFIVYIRTRIRYDANTVGSIAASYLSEAAGSPPVYLKAYGGLKKEDVSAQDTLLTALERPEMKSVLKKTDIECLKAFFSSLGTGDVEAEISLCSLYETLIDERLLAARQHADKYAGMYTVLGALMGLAVTILLV